MKEKLRQINSQDYLQSLQFYFHGIFATYYHNHSVEKREIHPFTEIFFREINPLAIFLVKPLLSRFFLSKCVRVNLQVISTH